MIKPVLLSLAIAGVAMSADYYVDSAATGAGDGSSWINAFATVQELQDSVSLKPEDTIFIESSHFERNDTLPSGEDYWWLTLNHGTDMGLGVISKNKTSGLPERMSGKGGSLLYHHTTAINAKADWCGINFVVDDEGAGSATQALRMYRGRYFLCDFTAKKHPMFFTSPYHWRMEATYERCVFNALWTSESYTFYGPGDPNSHVRFTNCTFNYSNTRAGGSLWTIPPNSTAYLYNCSFVGPANGVLNITAGSNSRVHLERCALPAGFDENTNFVHDGTAKLVVEP